MESEATRSITARQILAYRLSLLFSPCAWMLAVLFGLVTRWSGNVQWLDSPRFVWFSANLPFMSLIAAAGMARVLAFPPAVLGLTVEGKVHRSRASWRLAQISAIFCPLAMAWQQTLTFGGLFPHDKLGWLYLNFLLTCLLGASLIFVAWYLAPADEHSFLQESGIRRSSIVDAARVMFYVSWPLLSFAYLNKVAVKRQGLKPTN